MPHPERREREIPDFLQFPEPPSRLRFPGKRREFIPDAYFVGFIEVRKITFSPGSDVAASSLQALLPDDLVKRAAPTGPDIGNGLLDLLQRLLA